VDFPFKYSDDGVLDVETKLCKAVVEGVDIFLLGSQIVLLLGV